MFKKLPKLLVSGGAGFVGSAFVREAAKRSYRLCVVDKLTYAGDLKRLCESKGKYEFYRADICDYRALAKIFAIEKPEAVVHFAAETHVDRSINDANIFIETNVKGTHVLLELSRKHKVKRFIHISTDEVYGEIKKGSFFESFPLRPNNPYAASKASSDLLVRSFLMTHNVPAVVVRPCNNFGPWQYPEKLIPLVIVKAMLKEKIPVYGKGLNMRQWLYIDDCAKGILLIFEKGKIGDTYNLGGEADVRNIDIVKKILKIAGVSHRQITFVKDRPAHDYRYALDFSRAKRLGFRPDMRLEENLERTIGWYWDNRDWIKEKMKNLRKYWKRAYPDI
jgi:dTDP-glucose 4,6-dehydratase